MSDESAQDVQKINQYRVRWLSQRQKFYIRKFIIQNLFIIASVVAYGIRPFLSASWLRVDRPIFMVGCSRSGTTLLLDMFADHPEIANWSEAAQLFELRFCNPEIDHEKSECHSVGFEKVRLQVLIGLFVRLKRKSRFLNKHPENSLRIRMIKKIFPDARFIHVIRDGRAVMYSNYAQTLRDKHRALFAFGWFPKPPRWRKYRDLPWLDQFAHQWVDVVQYIRESVGNVIPEHDYMEIRYEDFCADPLLTLRKMDEFCGLATDRRNARPAPFEPQNQKWRTEISPEDMAHVTSIILPLLSELGYEQNDPTNLATTRPDASVIGGVEGGDTVPAESLRQVGPTQDGNDRARHALAETR